MPRKPRFFLLNERVHIITRGNNQQAIQGEHLLENVFQMKPPSIPCK